MIAGTATREEADELAKRLPRRGRAGRRARLGVDARRTRSPSSAASAATALRSSGHRRAPGPSGMRVGAVARGGGDPRARPVESGTASVSARIARDTQQSPDSVGGARRHPSRGPSGGSLGRRAFPRAPTRTRTRPSPRARRCGGRSTPRSPRWKPAGASRRPSGASSYALMLGLERVLSEKPPHLASGTELRRHQVDALAGMLTELIAANQKPAENGNGQRPRTSTSSSTRTTRTTTTDAGAARTTRRDDDEATAAARHDPGAVAPLPLPPSDRVRQDDRRRRIRRGRPHRGRPDPHPPPPARRPVPARADRARLRRPLHRRDPRGASRRCGRTRSRSRPTPGSRATSTRSRAPRTSS